MDPNDHYYQGREFYYAGNYAEAIVELGIAVKEDLNNWDARLHLGMSHFKSGDLVEASKVFRLVQQRCPQGDIRMKAMSALEAIETGLSTGEPVGSISGVLQKPTTEHLKEVHEKAKASQSGEAGCIIKPKPVLVPTPEAPPPKMRANPPVSGSAGEGSDTGATARRSFIPAPVGILFILICALGGAYWGGSLLIPDLYSNLFVQPSKQIGSGYSSSPPSGVEKEEITFVGPGGVDMNGIYLHAGSKNCVMINRATTGNIGEDWPLMEQLAKAGFSVFIYDYRGFGKSKGTATVQGMLDDGLLAHDYLSGKLHHKWNDIVLLGDGVGCGVATEIARRRTTQSLVLLSPYDNLINVARQRNPLFSIYPASMMPDRNYDNSAWAKDHKPVLIMTDDKSQIPVATSKQFALQISDPKRLENLNNDVMVKFIQENTPAE